MLDIDLRVPALVRDRAFRVLNLEVPVFTFDIEIADEIEVTGGWNRTDQMRIGVACSFDDASGRRRLYSDLGVGELSRAALREAVMAAPIVAGFNIWDFDLPLLFGVSRPEWRMNHATIAPGLSSRVFDVMRLARLGHRRPLDGPCGQGLNLQTCASMTLGRGKSGDGAEAPRMFAEGRLLELHQYVIDDVWLEHDLAAHARRNLAFRTGQGDCPVLPDPLWEMETKQQEVVGGVSTLSG